MHERASRTTPQVDAGVDRRNARYGLILFVLYLAFYSLYVILNAFWPQVMDAIPLAGVNLAILYGFGLIAVALLLALVYAWLCRNTG